MPIRDRFEYLAIVSKQTVSKRAEATMAEERGLRRHRGQALKAGVSFGSALAMVISWSMNKSLLWVIVHGLLSWVYVVYYAIRYHFD